MLGDSWPAPPASRSASGTKRRGHATDHGGSLALRKDWSFTRFFSSRLNEGVS
jgi:hypothetical protein